MLSDKQLVPAATFIGGHRKSGTTLLVTLLDGHPELSTVPTDSGFFYAYYPPYDGPKYTLKQKQERMLERCIHPFGDLVARLKGGRQLVSCAGRMEPEFLDRTRRGTGDSREMLLAMVMTYRQCSPLPKDRHRRWVEKTTSAEIYAADAKRWFPKARFIHVVRDPRDNYGSLKSGWEKRYKHHNDALERLLQSHIERGKFGMELARWNAERYGPRDYLVIRFEDLAREPQRVMRRVARFLGITFHPGLLQPTIWGLPWPGNNFEGQKFAGVSAFNVSRWRQRITAHEATAIEFYYSDIMEYFGYRPVFKKARQIDAARRQYAWHNYAQVYSV